jgi:5-methyltetrahydrofolate--homocysteine methyltransferase
LDEWRDIKLIARSITLAENGMPYSHLLKKPTHPYFATADNFYYKSLKDFALKHRGNPTEAENLLWRQIRDKQLDGIRFRRQHIIDKYIADFVSLENRLVIEIDGAHTSTSR